MSRQFLTFLSSFLLLLHASQLLVAALAGHAEAAEKEKKAYIVYMGERIKMEPLSIPSLHKSMLNQVIKSDGASARLIHSYSKSFNAFAAMLTENEAENLSSMDEVVSVFPSQQRQLHTTRSWDFMSFPSSAPHAAFESDVIVGMLDTGIWPESESFDDAGFGPPPHKWKGTCQTSNNNFTCNNKIIGARYYHLGGSIGGENIPSPRDSQGHGTHTASTAAGRLVANASLSGLAEGTARGGVPSARLAVYKVCWLYQGCSDVDVLAGFDDAIADGVDIISLSLGLESPIKNFFWDPFAIGSFHAVKNGILVSSSAGNNGPHRYSVLNSAPWMLTVAASTIDRKFIAQVKLGNGDVYQGVALNTDGSNGTLYPLIRASNAPNTSAGFDASTAKYCNKGSLNEDLTKGRVVICEHFNVGLGPQLAGAVGAIMPPVDTVLSDYAMQFKLPVSELEADDVAKVLRYSNTTSHPMASVEKSEGVFDSHAPYVVSFSSRGPNPVTSNLLKPDLTAPGVDILAAWSPLASQKSTLYSIISGTSMACPHVSGSAAYIKSFNPSWSPAAIKSALITTAFIMSPEKNPEAEFAYGAGHVNPIRALKPGLVYDADETDYIKFLCGQGYTTENLRRVTGDLSSCTSETNETIFDLNYPSFALTITKGKPFSATFHRTVTNVGDSNSNYKVNVTAPSGLKITVDPQILSFQSLLEKKSFEVKLEGETNETLISASLVWSDGVHNVRSPIVVYTA
ncbi:hypothetical protein IEQ34_008312 [Dendrobium chrysotoxum]|uniref:Cucumisin n=1 Tax=Dendrobium chrysotoxum TaxID=161865 RepID=A0AAV7GW67_DENCH|nr:hypothetical protein IEQ34_008312 [Dendrobium chrysotoxum]